jgi:hypothetical protein
MLVAADELLLVTVLLTLVMLDCKVEPLWLSALVKLLMLVAADELLLVTVLLTLVMLDCKVEPL